MPSVFSELALLFVCAFEKFLMRAIWNLRRLLQVLQNFGQVVPFSILPGSFALFHSALCFFRRARAASWPARGFFHFGFLFGAPAVARRRYQLRHWRRDRQQTQF
jgi:hypothetical protein